ncbi:MAG: molybdopterin-dependent oxidoreductase [Proteobacteria bacterium]|nr:molybdopterin-dependent oxidoreductase [Pseudomonadota bacterium]
MNTRKTICPLDCPDTCGMVATLEDGTITGLSGDPDHPFTKGFLCGKMRTYHRRVHSKDRILHPLKRSGRKGEGKFEPVSWDEAWTVLVDRLTRIKEEHGGEALLPYSYAGNMGLIDRWAGYPFFHKYGASQLLPTICSAAVGDGWLAHYGALPTSSLTIAERSDLIIAWGINYRVTNVHFMPIVKAARKRGAKVLVIDPYRNKTAEAADFYYPVRPGGDTALALGVLKYLKETDRLDGKFIENHTQDFEKLESYLEGKTLAYFSEESGLSEDKVREIGDLIADNPKTFIRIGIGLTRNTQGAMSVRAVACLAAALGLFDGGEGRGAAASSVRFSGDKNRLTYQSLLEKPTRTINMVQLGRALTELTPTIKALFVYNSNPLSVAPDAGQVRRGLERSDLFTVVHEQFMTPTARYADLLLPATTSFETSDIFGTYGHYSFGRTEPVLPPQGEALRNFDLFQTLARKMGYQDPAFLQSVEERIDDYVSTMIGISETDRQNGIRPGEYVESEWEAIGGDYSKFQGARFRFAAELDDLAQSDIPVVVPTLEFSDPALKERYPYMLITPPNSDLLNSTFGERHPNETGTVLIHPLDAKKESITTGRRVELFNHRGRTVRIATVSDKTQPGLLVAEGIYWEDQASEHTGINDLTSQATTDLGGGSTFHESRTGIRVVPP